MNLTPIERTLVEVLEQAPGHRLKWPEVTRVIYGQDDRWLRGSLRTHAYNIRRKGIEVRTWRHGSHATKGMGLEMAR